MTRIIREISKWWRRAHPSRTLEALPAYRDAVRREKRARQRNDTRAIGRARRARQTALHDNLRGRA